MEQRSTAPIRYGPMNPSETYVAHGYEEHEVDLGEITMNYAVTGTPARPAIVFLPAQGESWWGYEKVMGLLSDSFQVYAVDLRGQGRTTRTPGRYTVDNFGNDVVRFITYAVRRPVILSGLSSGGLICAWVSAYAPPGMIRGAVYEDPPLFSSELNPSIGEGIRQHSAYTYFKLMNQYLGDQWSRGDYKGFIKAVEAAFPTWPQQDREEPGQSIKEYDPEWARAFISGSVNASCDHAQMLSHVQCPVLFTHHRRAPEGALSEVQAEAVRGLITKAGQEFTYSSFPEMGHFMHALDPRLFADILEAWAATLPSEEQVRQQGIFASG